MTIFKRNTNIRPKPIDGEELIIDVGFNIHKITNKEKKNILIICCFSEFGCEVLGSMYCIPRIIKENPGCYYIIAGWYGREYLYRHLADEYWEIKEEFQWLRSKCLAFHYDSKNLEAVEKKLQQYGKVIPSAFMGTLVVGNTCNECSHFWQAVSKVKCCVNCGSHDIVKAIFSDPKYYKSQMLEIPPPNKLEEAKKYLGSNPVGVIARNRTTYGRNLPLDFYKKLLILLKEKGYTPIWLGEKQSTWPCPIDDVIDISRSEVAKDLELVLSIVAQLKFTIQFWTASTRLSAITQTPYIIFESPDQIYKAQEGFRMYLTTKGKRKVVLADYTTVFKQSDAALEVVNEAIADVEAGNWRELIRLVENEKDVKVMKSQFIAEYGLLNDGS